MPVQEFLHRFLPFLSIVLHSNDWSVQEYDAILQPDGNLHAIARLHVTVDMPNDAPPLVRGYDAVFL
jgi:hypothetical protein